MHKLRGRRIAYIPQEPMSNLDPSFTIGYQLVEPMRVAPGHLEGGGQEAGAELLARGRHPQPGAHLRRLSARGLRRHGPAGADRRRRLAANPTC